MKGWDFKSYVLGTMFYRYISESFAAYVDKDEHASGNADFSYADLSDVEAVTARDDLIDTRGFFMLPSQLFCNVHARAARDKADLNEVLEKAFRDIEASSKGRLSEKCFSGLFDDFVVSSNKLGATVTKRNEKLFTLLDDIAAMDLGECADHHNDTFGDAYEYLMAMYASNAGKSGGEFFTPAEVSTLLARIATLGKTSVNKVYGPACGSGSLLLKAAKVLGEDNVTVGFYGQDINITNYNLCRINMFLHGVRWEKFDIACDDTLTNPKHFDEEPFEVIVSNPPYSVKWPSNDDATLINDERFSPDGVLAPKSKADLAFVMHCLSWLSTNGTAAIVCFPGVMCRGGAEQKIRKYLVDNNFVDAVIQLPDNLFFGTSISTCILTLRKNKTDNSVLFINASKECVKVTNNNKLSDENIEHIISAYKDRNDIEYIARLAPYEDIVAPDYNLSVSTYVELEDTREKIDEMIARIDQVINNM